MGNHDCAFSAFIGQPALMPGHPLFQREVRAFEQTIGGRRFAFLHGHESDPYCRDLNPGTGEITAIISAMLEDRNRGPLRPDHAVEDEFVGTLEAALTLWRHLTFQHGRRDEMLDGVEAYRKEARADVVVYGHTHEPGCIGDYHFNSGCGPGPTTPSCGSRRTAKPPSGSGCPAIDRRCFPKCCDETAAMKPLEQYQAYPIPAAAIYFDAAFNCRESSRCNRSGNWRTASPRPAADLSRRRPTVDRNRGFRVSADRRPPSFPGRDRLPEVDRDTGLHLRRLERPRRPHVERRGEPATQEPEHPGRGPAIQNLYPKGASVRDAARELKQPTKWVHLRGARADARRGPAKGRRRPALAGEPGQAPTP